MDVLSAEGIRHRAGTRTIGRLLEVHEELPSTNAAALQRAGDAAHHGLVVFAEHQSAGRGRLNRAWHSPRGASILCSAVLFLDCRSVAGRGLPLWSAMAVRDALWESCNVNALIKWPNDLVVGNKKISGILIEARQLDHARWSYVVGVGINCLQHRGHFPGPGICRAGRPPAGRRRTVAGAGPALPRDLRVNCASTAPGMVEPQPAAGAPAACARPGPILHWTSRGPRSRRRDSGGTGARRAAAVQPVRDHDRKPGWVTAGGQDQHPMSPRAPTGAPRNLQHTPAGQVAIGRPGRDLCI